MNRLTQKLSALLLAFTLLLPNPAFALRDSSAREDPVVLAGLEQKLRSGRPDEFADGVVRLASASLGFPVTPLVPTATVPSAPSAAGLEESGSPEEDAAAERDKGIPTVYQEALGGRFTEILTEIAQGRSVTDQEAAELGKVLQADPVQTAILGIPPGSTAEQVVRERIGVMQLAWPGFSAWWLKHFEGKDPPIPVSTDALFRVYIPLSLWIVEQKRLVRPNGLYLFGMNGTQGQGKTVTSRGLVPILNVLLDLQAEGQAVAFATDDVYKRPPDRDQLRPLGYDPPERVSNRGPPGTSYAEVIRETIEKLDKSTPQSVTPIPNYDKGIDDYPTKPLLVRGKVGVLILEGWYFGANTRFNIEEIPKEETFKWAVAKTLQEELRGTFDRADALWFWKPPRVEEILKNRLEQEILLRKQRGPGKGMTDRQIEIFVRDYFYTWPWHMDTVNRTWAVTSPFPLIEEVTFQPEIDANRRFVSIQRGGRPIWHLIVDPTGQTLLDGKVLMDPELGVMTMREHDPVVTLPFEFWGIRHGQTGANALDLLQGVADEEINQLTELGKSQARQAAEELLSNPRLRDRIDRGELLLLTSPLGRARETAQIIVEMVQERTDKIIELIVDEQAKELDFGDLESKAKGELTSEQKEQADRIRQGLDVTVRPANGESFKDLLLRRHEALKGLSRQERYRGKTVVLIGHGMLFSADRILLGDETLLDHLHRIHYQGEGYELPNARPILLSAPAGVEEFHYDERKPLDVEFLTALLEREFRRFRDEHILNDPPGIHHLWRIRRYFVGRIDSSDGRTDDVKKTPGSDAYERETGEYVEMLRRLFPGLEIEQKSISVFEDDMWLGHGLRRTGTKHRNWVSVNSQVASLLSGRWVQWGNRIDAKKVLKVENGKIVKVDIEKLIEDLFRISRSAESTVPGTEGANTPGSAAGLEEKHWIKGFARGSTLVAAAMVGVVGFIGPERVSAPWKKPPAQAISSEEPIPAPSAVQEVFNRMLADPAFRAQLQENGFVPLDVQGVRDQGFRASAAFVIADSAQVKDGDKMILAEDDLRNEAVQRLMGWVQGGRNIPEVLRSAAAMGMAEGIGNVVLLKAEPGITPEMIKQLLAETGLAGEKSAQVVVGTLAQVEALPVLAFKIFSKKAGLPPVVVLSLAYRLQGEGEKTYTLLLMA